MSRPAGLTDDPLWYKDAVIYELHVRAFADSNGDGIGDFRGLTGKLDYLQDLGVTTLWLLPFYPSPLRDDGYDIADYTSVHASYGTLDDFREFLEQAHQRGLRVITELVINHTSDQHPWFQRARRARPGTPERDFYVWSDTPEKYREARIIFQDFEPSNWTYDSVAGAYYMHRFFSHQPDLNYDSPAVHAAILPAMNFWLDMGVDGLRLDAIPYLFKREGTSCENLPETHAYLKSLRRHVDERYSCRMFLAEANQWPEDASAYFGDGDECHMNFHFPLMPRLFMALRMEDRFPIVDILEQTPAIPANCQWAIFLRNHDELTLEMVTDEERDVMLRAYAADPRMRINLGIRRRLAPLLGNDRRRIELMHGLLFALPGTPVMYYGDEIGMGDNVYLGDRNGVRTPMHWSGDRNAGFSRANPQKLYLPIIIDPEYHYEANNVEAQQSNPHSLLWWVKRLLAMRRRWRAFGRGDLTFLQPENPRVLAFLRSLPENGERLLIVANLSRFVQCVELHLGEFAGLTPVEMFGQTPFPTIGREPYRLTIGPHGFFWFALTAPPAEAAIPAEAADVPVVVVRDGWADALHGPPRRALQELLPSWLPTRPWFRGGHRILKNVRIVETVPLPGTEPTVVLAGMRAEYVNGEPETYLVPFAFALAEMGTCPLGTIARLTGGSDGYLFDADHETAFGRGLVAAMRGGPRPSGAAGQLTAELHDATALPPDADVFVRTDPRGTVSVTVGDRSVLRVYRRLTEGTHPDLELGRALAAVEGAPIVPLIGSLEYRGGGDPVTVATLHPALPPQGDGWEHALAAVSRFFEQAAASQDEAPPTQLGAIHLLDRPPALELMGVYLDDARRLGERLAELHRALASFSDDARLAPEPIRPFHRRSIYQSMRNQTTQVFQRLSRRLADWPEETRPTVQSLLDAKPELLRRFSSLVEATSTTDLRIRVHGDCHLSRWVRSGADYLLAQFPDDRRPKMPALTDVADLIASWRHAAEALFYGVFPGSAGHVRSEDQARLGPWMLFWVTEVSAAFLTAYYETANGAAFLPADPITRTNWLDAFLLQRLVTDLGDDLIDRSPRAERRVWLLESWLQGGRLL